MVISTCSAPAEIEALTERLDLLNDQLRVLQDIAGEIREDLRWGLENGRVQLIVAEADSLDDSRESTVAADAVTLTLRLHAALSQLRDEIIAAIESQQIQTPTSETSTSDTEEDITGDPERSELPPIELLEAGDAVEFELEGEIWFGEIAAVDDAENSALVQLIPSYEEVEVPQDLLTRIEPDELSRREEVWTQIMDLDHETSSLAEPPAVGDRVRLNLHGHELEGEVNAVQRLARTVEVVLTPSMEMVTVEWEELIPGDSRTGGSSSALQETIEPLSERMAEHDRWCHEVRDPAEKHSEGSRIVTPANGKALVEYEVAPLPNGEWAVHWAHRFLCGDVSGAGHPWTVRPTRDDCIELVLQTSRKMFSAKHLDKVQIPIAREMLHLLGEGLFGFHEPQPQDSNILDPSGLAAAAEAVALRFEADAP